MAVVMAILICICVLLAVQYIRGILAVRSLHMQLEEIGRGSRMELGAQSRQKDILALCRTLNQLSRLRLAKEIQYEKAERQLKQNVTSLAHDIRTPLTGASGYLQLARECQERAKRERYLAVAEERLEELKDMLEELFLYTKITREEYEMNICQIQALPLLGDCLVGFYRQFEEKGIAPQVEFEEEGIRFLADEACLRRIFHNLIQNALLHGQGGLWIRQEGSSLIFENPVAEADRPDTEQMFERFYKADSARGKGSSGLGLFIVRELTEKMGGSVRARMLGGQLQITVELIC